MEKRYDMEKFKEDVQKLTKRCFEGEVTVSKVNLWLAMTACLLFGIVYGLRKAPMTHGVMIGSYNGNAFGGCRHKQEKCGGQEEDGKEIDEMCEKNGKKRRCRCKEGKQ